MTTVKLVSSRENLFPQTAKRRDVDISTRMDENRVYPRSALYDGEGREILQGVESFFMALKI